MGEEATRVISTRPVRSTERMGKGRAAIQRLRPPGGTARPPEGGRRAEGGAEVLNPPECFVIKIVTSTRFIVVNCAVLKLVILDDSGPPSQTHADITPIFGV